MVKVKVEREGFECGEIQVSIWPEVARMGTRKK